MLDNDAIVALFAEFDVKVTRCALSASGNCAVQVASDMRRSARAAVTIGFRDVQIAPGSLFFSTNANSTAENKRRTGT